MYTHKHYKSEFKEFLYKFFPCTCAYYLKDKNKIDPHCFTCYNYKKLYIMFKTIRETSLLEGKKTTLKAVSPNAIITYDTSILKEIDPNKFWVGENFKNFYQ